METPPLRTFRDPEGTGPDPDDRHPLALRSRHADAGEPAFHLHASRFEPYLGLLFGAGAAGTGSALFAGRPVVAVRVERHDRDVVLRHPTTHAYLCASEAGQPEPFAFHAEPRRVFFEPAASGPVPLPAVAARLSTLERAGLRPSSPPALAALLQDPAPGIDRNTDLILFWFLLDFVEQPALLRALPLLADCPRYGEVFAGLRRRLGGGDGTFPLTTRAFLRQKIDQYGWTVGEHTYGHPLVMEEKEANLSIGRYCSIAGLTTIVLGNHTTTTATTYPFAALRSYWPQATAGIDLVDHVGRDVSIGHDVWIGLGAVVLPGTSIGHGAIIAANAVARGRIPPYAVVAGNPGRVVRFRFDEPTIARLLAVAWWDWPVHEVDRFIPLLLDPDVSRFLDAAETGTRLPKPALPNIALGRPATQSSLFPFSANPTVETDAAGLVSGVLSGSYQNHTALEAEPWWQVDLGAGAVIRELRLHNRLDPDTAGRADHLRILVSNDAADWTLVHEHPGDRSFGGLDGRPFTWRPATERGLAARFLRLQLRNNTCLHLDQVEVFGIPPP